MDVNFKDLLSWREKKVLNYHSCLKCFWKNGFKAKIDSFYSLSANINSLGRITEAKCCKSMKVKLAVKVRPVSLKFCRC